MAMKRRVQFLRLKFSIHFLDFSLILVTMLFFINFYATLNIMRRLQAVTNLPLSFIVSQISFLVIVVILLVNIMLFLHRGLGPIPRIESILDRVLNGERSLRIKLRKKDILQSLVVKLNKILDLLESKSGS
jgi:methyl-accepting chemotaxis protein